MPSTEPAGRAAPCRAAVRWGWVVLCGGLLVALVAERLAAEALWPEEEQRLRVGLKLFPACLGGVAWSAATVPTATLRVAVVYRGAEETARLAVEALNDVGAVRGYTLQVTAVTSAALPVTADEPPHALFIASVGIEGAQLRDWSERYHALVFSPFEGQVEQGAVAGVFVSDRILPYVNLTQARRAGLTFKPFFLDVAKRYE